MKGFRQLVTKFLRSVLPKRFKGWLYKLSVSSEIDGSIFYHIGLLQKLGYRPQYVIDVGAFRGEWTEGVLPIFPSATFIMIEPQDDKKQVLEGLAQRFSNVKYIKCLVGKSANEKVTFYEMESGSSIYEEQTSHYRTVKSYSMQTLDQAMGFELDGEVFLKLDVQGAEIDVLEGAIGVLRCCNFLLLETSLLSYNDGAPLVGDIFEYMTKQGFVLFDVCDSRRKENGILFQVDLLFSRRDNVIRSREDFQGKSIRRHLSSTGDRI